MLFQPETLFIIPCRDDCAVRSKSVGMAAVCPNSAISDPEGWKKIRKVTIDHEKCGACAKKCRFEAIGVEYE